jgi:hypothetical protein
MRGPGTRSAREALEVSCEALGRLQPAFGPAAERSTDSTEGNGSGEGECGKQGRGIPARDAATGEVGNKSQ